MSTIKNIVTAPLSWFAANEEFEDTPGKRRRAVPRDGLQQESRTVKRQRLRSPSPLPPTQGYLDPPHLLFQSPTKLDSRSQAPTQSTAFSPSVSINIPTNSQQLQQHLGRHTYSPIPTTSYSQHHLPRTMSMDPPQPQILARDPTLVPLPYSREHSIASVSRDHSMGPTRTSFRMRTTLSPLPSGNEFGPKPRQRERDPSEPPPLTALMSNPIFVKPPPDAHPMQRSLSAQPTTTLGSLAQIRRPTRSPLRHSSGLLFGSQASSSKSDPSSRPVNASEIALSELAVYRTPLLPSRLRGSSSIPDMFKPKKVHQIVPMRKGKDELPRLGTGEKKAKKGESGKPYLGQGGMKKLLARRKLEAEEEKKRQKSETMTDDSIDDDEPEVSVKYKSPHGSVPVPVVEPVTQQRRTNGREISSLRVGRTKIRQHLEPTRPNKTKFSAAYEEDDYMDQQEDGEEPPKPVPIFEVPKGFSFAKEAAPAPIPTAVDDAKEPPIAALPFSLTRSVPAQDSPIKAPAPLFIPSFPAPSQSAFSFTSDTPSISASPTPAISFTPPIPQAASKQSDVSAPSLTIPNFFSNSPLLSKSTSAPPTPPITNSFRSSPVPEKSRSAAPEVGPLIGSDAAPSTPQLSLFGNVSRSTSTGTSLFGSPAPAVSKAEDKPPAPSPVFDSTSTKSAETPATSSSSLFGRAEHKATPLQSLGSVTGGSLSQKFGVPNPEPTAPPSNEILKPPSLFGGAGTTTFSGFGTGSTSEVPKPLLTFGQPSASQSTVVEPPKPLFGPGPITNSDPKDAAKAPFTFEFGTTPPQSSLPKFKVDPAPVSSPAEKASSTLFSSTPASAPSPSPIFSFSAANTETPDTSKSYFRNNTPRAATPPKNDQEERMEESPTRSMDTNEKPTTSGFFASRTLNFGQSEGSGGTSTPFTFGSSSISSNPFASKPEDKLESRSASSGFSFGSSGGGGGFGFGQKEPEPSRPTFSSAPPFTFGKPETRTQQTSSTSPFGFGTQKLPEINTSASSGGFSFGQKPPESSQGTSSFGFGQSSPASTTTSPFAFGSNQGAVSSSFGQQNASAPSSPSTFNQPPSFSFGNSTTPSTAPSNPFGFQPSSPVSNPAPNGSFSFGQSTTPQPQSPASPFSAPTSPQTTGGALFTIGAAPNNPTAGARQIKKLPTRRGGKR